MTSDLQRCCEGVISDSWSFVIRRGSDLVKGTLSRFASQDLDALRTLGTIEVELSFGGDVHRGPAKELAWS